MIIIGDFRIYDLRYTKYDLGMSQFENVAIPDVN
jgi:hypothetical protein